MMLNDEQLGIVVRKAFKKAQKAGELPPFDLPASIQIERPKQSEMGDYATPICLQLSRYARMAPLRIAEILVRRLSPPPFVGRVEIAHPGFVNFTLADNWLTSQVKAILASAETYGSIAEGQGRRVQVEYVSANPTGPLHIGSARNAVLGDTLAALLEAAGYDVQREYYVNNAGSRVRAFYETLYARYAQALGQEEAIPEDGYQGPYMIELGARIAKTHGRKFLEMPREEGVAKIGQFGLEVVLEEARNDLADLRIVYDNWFFEESLYNDGQFDRIMASLRERGYLYKQDGAGWFKATALGVSKDEVIVRSNGTPGYFASDIAYHYNKFVERKFEQVIDVWGADHQGHVPRMRAMMQALGLDPERLIVIIHPMVTLKRGGEVVRLSKRTGDIITLREVLDEVGPDAMRYFLLSRSADSHMDFDIELAKQQTDENPVYYVQYAHARICSILRHAGNLDYTDGDVSLLTSPPELTLLRHMVRLPEIVHTAVQQLAPHHLTYYAYELASAFHAFYRDCRVVSSEPGEEKLTKARLLLVSACKVVLART